MHVKSNSFFCFLPDSLQQASGNWTLPPDMETGEVFFGPSAGVHTDGKDEHDRFVEHVLSFCLLLMWELIFGVRIR